MSHKSQLDSSKDTFLPRSSASESTESGVAPALYLIPTPISDAPVDTVLPDYNIKLLKGIRHFIVENLRDARRFIKRVWPEADISALQFSVLNRHTEISEVSSFLEPLRCGQPVGVMSDAGCPAIADPGALPVAIAQREGFRVKALVGPSSILMALMGSGFSGQGFSFHGYLPIDDEQRRESLRILENESQRRDMTQIFIETPYRNEKTLDFMAHNLRPATRICIACDITDPVGEKIIARTAGEWKGLLDASGRVPEFDKRPAIFLIYAGGEESVQQTKSLKGDFRVKNQNGFNKIKRSKRK